MLFWIKYIPALWNNKKKNKQTNKQTKKNKKQTNKQTNKAIEKQNKTKKKVDFVSHHAGEKYTNFFNLDMMLSPKTVTFELPYKLMYSASHIMQCYSHDWDVYTP